MEDHLEDSRFNQLFIWLRHLYPTYHQKILQWLINLVNFYLNSSDRSTTASDEQMSQTMRLGEIYRSRIISLLTPIVGAGNLKAEVNVDRILQKRDN